MRVKNTGLDGVVIIEIDLIHDDRGFFSETYQEKKFKNLGISMNIVQENHSFSRKAGTIRGLHYQLEPMAQSKLVRVTAGAIYDVVVDIRPQSPSFGKWVSVIISEDNHRQLLVPKGYAHGFCTLTTNTHVLYKVDQFYSKAHERGIIWSDPSLAIDWPVTEPVLSDKDKLHPMLEAIANNEEGNVNG
ncbi:dTDP-4-dehydrorhamnose 3,5-epimerase [Paenibacillus methanolicus]|uniref:dTDP-4-dehydrorhamnose 3,5-epimerase n=1 Tax=Paenibacillus methanolicus TaxID=582686 RepID=A0A5S5BVW2_9BACL|nr:dTDP-4-dehydrorhamnose 3,5-epimerase [Paenibacillus methanolicus]TYP70290.1 dTDP-4-dehydrorhamnose 3,5-epimerase [Paenibacillus methanolicus]